MEDPRNRELKKLMNSYCYMQQSTKFHMQRILAEEVRFEKSVAHGATNHKKLESLEKLNEFHDLFKESLRQLNKLTVTIQQFLDFNPELKDTKNYKEASILLELQKAEDVKNQTLLSQEIEEANAASGAGDASGTTDHSPKEQETVSPPQEEGEPVASEVVEN